MATIRKAVFPVGGLGTRFLPATKVVPKEMLPVVDKPLIHYAYDEARAAGIEEFIFVSARNKDAIADHFDHAYELERLLTAKDKQRELGLVTDWLPDPGHVVFARQMEPKGLGHAVWCARHWIGNEPFAVILPDDLVLHEVPCLKQMVDQYDRAPGNMAAIMDVPKDQTHKYGILDVAEAHGQIVTARGLVEKPKPETAPSTLSIIGRYILQPTIFEQLERQQTGSGGEIQLTDAMSEMIERVAFYGYRFDGVRYDCGERVGYIEANVAFALAEADEGLGARVRAQLEPYFMQNLRDKVGT